MLLMMLTSCWLLFLTPEKPLSLPLLCEEYLVLPPLLTNALLPALPVLRPEDLQEELRGLSTALLRLARLSSCLSQSIIDVCRRLGMETPSPGTPDTPLHRPEAVSELVQV